MTQNWEMWDMASLWTARFILIGFMVLIVWILWKLNEYIPDGGDTCEPR